MNEINQYVPNPVPAIGVNYCYCMYCKMMNSNCYMLCDPMMQANYYTPRNQIISEYNNEYAKDEKGHHPGQHGGEHGGAHGGKCGPEGCPPISVPGHAPGYGPGYGPNSTPCGKRPPYQTIYQIQAIAWQLKNLGVNGCVWSAGYDDFGPYHGKITDVDEIGLTIWDIKRGRQRMPWHNVSNIRRAGW